MGLDWHSAIPMTFEERMEVAKSDFPTRRVRQENGECGEEPIDWDALLENEGREQVEYLMKLEGVPDMKAPCSHVGAPRMKERATFREDMAKFLAERKKQAEKYKQDNHPNKHFVEYWESMTLEQLMEKEADKFDCEYCPYLAALNGSDSTNSFFIGVTVSSCDFRGKIIAFRDELPDHLTRSAYNDRTPEEMLIYADQLEKAMMQAKNDGAYNKPSYEDYCKEWDADPWPFKEPKMTEEEYEKSLHPAEQAVRRGIHWLRTAAKYGVHMITSF